MDTPHSDIPDEQLALLVAQGDKERFGLLMERYEQKLFRYGKKFLANNDDIDDVVQEVFIKAYENIQGFDTTQKFSPWIYRIAHNTFINALRKNSRGPMYLFDFEAIIDSLVPHTIYENPAIVAEEEREIKLLLEEGLAGLSANYREIIILHYIEEQSYKEISDILRIPIGTVGIRLKRARDTLRNNIHGNNIHGKKIQNKK